LHAHPDVRRRLALSITAFGTLAAAACLLAPLAGSTPINLLRVFDRSVPFSDNVEAQIFFVARLPRVVAAAIVGGTLAAAGTVFQALFRNPLAGPDTLGVSAGAALGAIVAITFHLEVSIGGLSSVPLSSLAGSLGALGIVYLLATARRRGMSTTVLLLAGVTMTAFFSALIMFTQYLADFTDTFRMVRWLMGMLDIGSYTTLLASGPLLLAAFAMFATLPRALDLLSLGADAAAARGVDVPRAERVALVSASLATGAAVSIAGPVGFIGIIVPHLVRSMVGSDHRIVLPSAALFGAAFLVACDLVARTVFSPLEVPVGVVTAMIGGPFFLWLLLRGV
jgi:iron complex transport system permease protein